MKAKWMRQLIVFACALCVLGKSAPCGAKDSTMPELAVLQNYVGVWDAAFTIEANELTAVVTAKWILGGRFVQQTATIESATGEPFSITTLMTYDTGAKMYRSWSFTSEGTTSEGTGSWDAESKTLTTRGEDKANNTKTTITAGFAKDGEEHWSIATEGASGTATSVVTGVNVRRGKK